MPFEFLMRTKVVSLKTLVQEEETNAAGIVTKGVVTPQAAILLTMFGCCI